MSHLTARRALPCGLENNNRRAANTATLDMHILEIPSFFPPYGGLFCLDQSKALAFLGHEVRIIAHVQLSVKKSPRRYILARTTCRETEMGGITVWRKEMRGLPKCVRPNVRRWVRGVLRMFRHYVDVYGKPDVIHAHCVKWAGYAAYMISKEHGVPFVITEHLPKMIYAGEFGGGDAWQIAPLREALQSAAMVIPVSAELVDDLACYFGRDYRWTAISNTIDTSFFAFRRREPRKNRPFRLCAIANFVPRKGYDVLFAAFSRFCERHPGAELTVAGAGTDGKECSRMMGSYPCAGRMRAAGELDKMGVRALLYWSDCLVLATRSESQGLVLLEAMSTGIRAITTSCVPRNARIDGGTIIVPVDDVDAMADAMSAVYEDVGFDGRPLSAETDAMVSPAVIGKKIERVLAEAAGKAEAAAGGVG